MEDDAGFLPEAIDAEAAWLGLPLLVHVVDAQGDVAVHD